MGKYPDFAGLHSTVGTGRVIRSAGMAVRLKVIGAETAAAIVAAGVVSFSEVAMRTANAGARHSVPDWQVHVLSGSAGPKQIDCCPSDSIREICFAADGFNLLLEEAIFGRRQDRSSKICR
jgi:hypothetical protein